MDKFPEALMKPKPRTLADLKPGERSAFPLYAIRVDAERKSFVFLSAELPPPSESTSRYGEIWLDEKGKYHVSIPDKTRHRWDISDLRLYEMASTKFLAPIETVTWESP